MSMINKMLQNGWDKSVMFIDQSNKRWVYNYILDKIKETHPENIIQIKIPNDHLSGKKIYEALNNNHKISAFGINIKNDCGIIKLLIEDEAVLTACQLVGDKPEMLCELFTKKKVNELEK